MHAQEGATLPATTPAAAVPTSPATSQLGTDRAAADHAAANEARSHAREEPAHARPSQPVQLTLSSDQAGLTVYKTQDRVYGAKLCSPDCTRAIKPGAYSFGLRTGQRKVVWDDRVFAIEKDQTLFVHYESRRPSRITGGVLLPASLLTGLLGGMALGVAVGLGEAFSGERDTQGRVAIGVFEALCAVLAISSIWLMTRADRARIMTPAERARTQAASVVTGSVLRLSPNHEVSQRAMACAPPEDRRIELTVEIDGAHVVRSLRAPSTFGHGARRCLYAAIRGEKVGDAPAGSWTLVLER